MTGATLQLVYSIPVVSDGSPPELLTANQGVYSASFSPSGRYFVLNYQGPSIPKQYLVSVDGYNITLEDNSVYPQLSAVSLEFT